MGKVVKKGGKKGQAFSPAKVRKSIQKSAKDAKLSKAKTDALLKEVADPVISQYKKKRVKSSDLRRSILGRLDRKSKKVASAWKKYDRKKK